MSSTYYRDYDGLFEVHTDAGLYGTYATASSARLAAFIATRNGHEWSEIRLDRPRKRGKA